MSTNKRIVLDANILIRAVLGTKVRGIIQNSAPSVQFFTPDFCYDDAVKYLPMLFAKRNLPTDDALEVLDRLVAMINIVEANVYSLYENEAKQRISVRDINDWPIVAASLLLDCPVWTEDSDFFGSGVATWTSDRIHLYFL
jgi:predicted nucleic acid-binding protein